MKPDCKKIQARNKYKESTQDEQRRDSEKGSTDTKTDCKEIETTQKDNGRESEAKGRDSKNMEIETLRLIANEQ